MFFSITAYLFLCILTIVFFSKSDSCISIARSREIKNNYINWTIFFLILITGFRNLSVGPDTAGYYMSYRDLKSEDWDYVIGIFKDYYQNGVGKDVGFSVFRKIFQTFGVSFRFFLIIVAALFFVPYGWVMKLLERNIAASFYAFLMFIALFLIYAFSSIRQDIALSATLISFKFIRERRLIPFLILIIAASTIHKSALLFLPYYWIANINKVKTMSTITAVMLPVLFMFARPIGLFLAQTSGQESYIRYIEDSWAQSGTPVLTTMLLGCFVLYLLNIQRLNEHDPKHHFYTNTIFLSVGLLPITWIDPTLVRTLLYFIIYLPIIISNCLVLSPKSYKRQLIIVYFILISYFFIKSFPPYDFFWNYMPMGENYAAPFDTTGI